MSQRFTIYDNKRGEEVGTKRLDKENCYLNIIIVR